MIFLLATLCILTSVYVGYLMGQGKDLTPKIEKMKKAVRTEEQEAELQEKIFKNKVKLNG